MMMLKTISVCVLLATSFSVVKAADNRPNLVFLMADDQCTYSMGCYGNEDVQTPNLDRLAADGLVFDRHYATTAICMASRATVMTGMFEFKTGCNFEHGDMINDTWQKSYPVLLREAGYRTAFAGKFGFSVKSEPNGETIKNISQNFDAWAGGPGQTSYKTAANKALKAYAEEYPHSTLAYGAFGSDFIKESVEKDQPFCLSISFKAPHKPAEPDPRFDEIYRGKTFRKPENFGRENGEHFSKQSRMDRQFERFYSWHYADNYDGEMATYHQQVHGIDQAVGMISKALKEAGADKNTIVIFTSDNGFLCGSHGYGSKVLPYEEASRIPLVVYDPRESNSGRGLRCDALTGLCDVAPTLLTLSGLSVPDNMDGRDLMELYRDPAAKIHEALPLMNVWGKPATHSLSVVDGEYKYIYWFYTDKDQNMQPVEELYQLTKDPLELKNLAVNPEAQPVLQKLREAYDQQVKHWKEETVDYNGYREYGTLFDRQVPWETKARILLEKNVKNGSRKKNSK
ncbi:Arylsulfatase [Planctomycetes bacterium CA13]|uniref:Arylsulfatase n=1 Tax=Novipirellula herctigrandis TaxID=2527986 RepID=A0A5C5Z3H6_9BACT|nr:Arylsulfatase [Planctomycetes bacterium CA13]